MSHEPERLNAADAAILNSIRRRVLAMDGATVSRIILFGSRARGAARPDSDYDVFVLVRDLSPAERRRYLDALYRAFEGGGAIVEPWVMSEEEFEESKTVIGGLACENVAHVLRSLATAARLTLHVDVLRGENDHHRAEAAFKAVALALRQAVACSGSDEIPSTKGVL